MRPTPSIFLACLPLLTVLMFVQPGICLAEKAKPPVATPVPAPAAKKAAPKAPSKPKVKRNYEMEVKVEPAPAKAGKVTLEDLILAALRNNPDVVKRRGSLDIAYWAKEAAKDWEDPEFRFSYGTQYDIGVADPYSDRIRSSSNYSGDLSETSSESGLGFSRLDTQNATFNESRYRTIERTVIPGDTSTRIIEREYEERSTLESGRNTRRERDGTKLQLRDNSNAKNTTRRLIGETITERSHPSTTESDEKWAGMIRFNIPNPFERSARIKAAESSMEAADWDLQAAVHETTLEVKALYEKLVLLNVTAKQTQDLAKQRYQTTNMATEKVAKNAADALKAQMDEYQLRAKILGVRREFAKLTGLKNLDNIVTPNEIRVRKVGLSEADHDYLLTMASKLNPRYQSLRQKFNAARYKTEEERAKRIPFPGYLDFGLEGRNSANGANEKSYFFRLGLSLPLFSNTINRSEDAARAEARSFSQQQGHLAEILDADITQALSGIVAAEQMLKEVEKVCDDAKIYLQQSELESVTSDKAVEAMGDAKELDFVLAQKLEFYSIYNQSVARLEAAMGFPLEKVLQKEGK